MQKSFFFTIVLAMSFSTLFSQSLDSYKYILIPNQYEFQKSQDQYQVNSLVKFLFNRAGYTAFLEGEDLPEDLRNSNCLAAKAFVEVKPSMLSVKTVVRLEDCFGKTILVTNESKSKEKAYKKAYHESIRKNFMEIEGLTYSYAPNKKEGAVTKVIVEPKKIVETKKEIVTDKVDNEELIKKEFAEYKKKNDRITVDVDIDKSVKEKKIKAEKKLVKTKRKKLGEPEEKIEMIKLKPAIISLLGNYEVGSWGKSEIVKKGDDYVIIGGDENIEVATIYKTSKPNMYIIKWLAFKQPQLVQVDSNGTLRVDAESGVKYYKRVN